MPDTLRFSPHAAQRSERTGTLVARARLAAVASAKPGMIAPGFLSLALDRNPDFVARATHDATRGACGHRGLPRGCGAGCWSRGPCAGPVAGGGGADGAGAEPFGQCRRLRSGLCCGVDGLVGTGSSRRTPGGRCRLDPALRGRPPGRCGRARGGCDAIGGLAWAHGLGHVDRAAGEDGVRGGGRVAAGRGTASLVLFLFTLPARLPAGVGPFPAVLAASAAAVALALGVGLRARTPDT